MLKPLQNFQDWLGSRRFWFLIGAFVVTGIASVNLTFVNTPGIEVFQNMLAFGFILVAAFVIGSRMSWQQRLTGLALMAPALGLILLALLFVPEYRAAAFGGAVGWILVGAFIFGRNQAPIQYRDAVKALRKNDFKAAVQSMDELIRVEPDVTKHYRFRARLLRLWNKPGRARRDYQTMIDKSDDPAVLAEAYNELSELELQLKNYDAALAAAQQAAEYLPNEWVTHYNIGMIQDRLRNSQKVITSLETALEKKIPDSRHRLLVYLWQARAYSRLKQLDDAQAAVSRMENEYKGLEEWGKILKDEQAAVLRDALESDVELARQLLKEDLPPAALAEEPAR